MSPTTILTIACMGYVILVWAIGINAAATALGITTRYGFLNGVSATGLPQTLQEQSIGSLLFLFIVYPLLLWALWWATIVLLRQTQ